MQIKNRTQKNDRQKSRYSYLKKRNSTAIIGARISHISGRQMKKGRKDAAATAMNRIPLIFLFIHPPGNHYLICISLIQHLLTAHYPVRIMMPVIPKTGRLF
jgi:hypothetical protein